MSTEEKTFTYSDVAEHNTKKDVYLVVHDVVYNTTDFVDEHPGGEEVMFEVAGQDATEAFEDVGHSDEAREILEGMRVGVLKRTDADPKPKTTSYSKAAGGASTNDSAAVGLGIGVWAFVLLGGAVAFAAWKYLERKEQLGKPAGL